VIWGPYVSCIGGEKIGPLTNRYEDLTMAARNALIEIMKNTGLTPEQAYVVVSVAVDLYRPGQCTPATLTPGVRSTPRAVHARCVRTT
jgi:hypothetical protein